MGRSLLLVALLALAHPTAGVGQQRECDIVHADFLDVFDQGTPFERVVIQGDVDIRCAGGVTLRADSAVSRTAVGHREFIGRVVYRDAAKSLTADRADYFHAEARLVARGRVVLTDLEKGSVIRGRELEYFRETAGRRESRTIVRGRPHATLRDRRAPAEGAAPPLEIDADEMVITGERLFRAVGRVALERGETHGSARQAEFDQLEDRLLLTGDAIVEGEDFTLTGGRIEARLDGEELREVWGRDDAILLADELRLDAPELRVYFREGAVHRLVAMRLPAGGDPAGARPGGPPRTVGPQPRATATDFWLTADSIDAVAPAQRLETVVAVGHAYSERTADSLSAAMPELVARDWLRGDTITGHFTTLPAAEPGAGGAAADSAGERTALERLVAVGPEGRARSLYRIREEGPEAAPSVNYLIANRIVLFLRDGEVTSVEADGPIEGVHLQPKGGGNGRPEPGVAGAAPPGREREPPGR